MNGEIKAILFKQPTPHIKDEQGITNLEITHLQPQNPEAFSLEEMQAAIGGYIVPAGTICIGNKNYIILVDEEGIPKQRPLNHGFYWSYGKKFLGNVLLIREDLFK